MRIQRKGIAAIAFAALLSITAAGCASSDTNSSSSGSTTDSTSDATSGEITVAAQAWMITKLRLGEMAENFETANPGVTINVVEYADTQALTNFSLLWSQGKSDQDIVVVDGASTAVQFLAQDLTIDFNEAGFFEGSTAKDKFIGESLSFTELDGIQFAIPLGLETYNISANKKFFGDAGLLDSDGNIPAPESWDEVYEMASAMTERDGNGNVTRPGMTIQWGPNAVSTMIATHQAVRGSFYQADGVTLTFDTPEMREVLKVWKKGADDGVFSIDTFSDKDAGRNNFNAGNVPMILQTAAHVAEAIPTIGAKNSVVVAMPGSSQNGSYGFSAGIIVPKASQNQELAIRFIQEAMMSDEQTAFAEQWGKLPVTNAQFEKIDADWKTAIYDLVKISKPAPMYRDLPVIQVTGKQLLQEYLTDVKDLDEFLASFEKVIADSNKNAR